MKRKRLAITCGLLMVLCAVLASGFFTETRQGVWQALRTGVAADDTALDGTTAGLTWVAGDRPTLAIEVDPTWNTIEVYFTGTNAENETGNYIIYCWKSNGPALAWCNGAFTLGAGVTGETTEFYCDTITETDIHGTTSVVDSGNDRVCVLKLGSTKGVRYVYAEIDIDTNASVSAWITGY